MNATLAILALLLALAAGGAIAWAVAERGRTRRAEADAAAARGELAAEKQSAVLRAEAERQAAMAQAGATAQAVADTLVARASQTFQAREELAQTKLEAQLKPIAEMLASFKTQVAEADRARAESAGALKQHIDQMLAASTATQEEARKLSTALRRGAGVQGRWGEQMLRNVLELAGMQAGIDFEEQAHMAGEGGAVRPDVLVRLPGGGRFIIDAKCSLTAFDEAVAALDDVAREAAFGRHADSLRRHLQGLSAKGYWDRFDPSPDFVAMFVPGDGFLAAALERLPDLMREAMDRRVVLTTPTTLFALCKAVAYGWRMEAQAQNTARVAELGRDLYKRLATMTEHVEGLGKSLAGAMKAYNGFVGSLESQVLTQARRFAELKVDHEGKSIPQLGPVDGAPRPLVKLAAALTAETADPTSPA